MVERCSKLKSSARTLVHWVRWRTRAHRIRALIKSLHPRSPSQKLIRFGPMGDGGYLIPDDLEGVSACFSPGVNFVSGFEHDCAVRGMKVFLADGSVDGPPDKHERFFFKKCFLGGVRREGFMTLDDWVASSVPDESSDFIMQMDIEGHEYEVFLATSDALMRRFRIIVAEFHGLDHLVRGNSQLFREKFLTFNRILKTHSCVHLHPNNHCGSVKRDSIEIPGVMEFTFLRNDRFSELSYRTDFPHPLDCDNRPVPPLMLPKCWYRQEAVTEKVVNP